MLWRLQPKIICSFSFSAKKTPVLGIKLGFKDLEQTKMGESIFLARSFSQPADFASHETNELVPHRVVTESVSFGRFANETLSWEKWSAFTQNRYLEEVERFTKPGSVAEKKAFFEAHFKSRASGRAAHTKKIGEVKSKTSDEVVCKVPLVVNNGTGVNEVSHGEVSTNEVDFAVPSVSIMDETTDVQTGEVEVTTNVENLNTISVLEDKALDEDNSISLSKERLSSSSGLKACSTSSKLEPSFVIGLDHPAKNTRKESSSSSERPISVLKNRNRSPPEPPAHMSLRCAPSVTTDKTIVGMSQGISIAKSAGKADKKKTSGPNSVHMSLTFASSASQSTIIAPKDLARNSTTQETNSSNAISSGKEPMGASKSRKRPFHRTSKEGSTAPKCSTSASAARLPELPPPKKQLSENKRKNISVGSSVSCKIPNKVQRQPSVGSENLSIHSRTKAKSFTVSSPFVFKSNERAERKKEVELEKMERKRSENLSTHSRTKAKSFTVTSPFVFRSDERAERRKEFFQKLEEKNKKEDAVKEKLSCGFKANQNTHLPSEEHKKNPEVDCFQVPLISLTSPRFRRNQTPGAVQAPRKAFSPKIINTKPVKEKLKSCKIQPSSKSQTKIKTQENVSPNIMQQ